jgi:hypothetical protein
MGVLLCPKVAVPICLHVAIFMPVGSDTLGQGGNPPVYLCQVDVYM